MSLANDVFPAGIVLPYAGTTAPTGWLLCDETSYLRDNYPRLFSAISTAHGSNAANTFNVPDYRGRFLRGTDNMGTGAANRDPDRAARTAANTGGNTGNTVGSVQLNATAVNGLTAATSFGYLSSTKPGTGYGAFGSYYAGDSGVSVSSTDTETRPLNAYVNYIIKI